MTPLMLADQIATEFNGSADRSYWVACPGGGKAAPSVIFKSRASMVRVTYWVERCTFSIEFTKTQCAFGDFMASAQRSLSQITAALKSAGVTVASPLDDKATLRLQYDPVTKAVTCALALDGQDWTTVSPVHFKATENSLPNISL